MPDSRRASIRTPWRCCANSVRSRSSSPRRFANLRRNPERSSRRLPQRKHGAKSFVARRRQGTACRRGTGTGREEGARRQGSGGRRRNGRRRSGRRKRGASQKSARRKSSGARKRKKRRDSPKNKAERRRAPKGGAAPKGGGAPHRKRKRASGLPQNASGARRKKRSARQREAKRSGRRSRGAAAERSRGAAAERSRGGADGRRRRGRSERRRIEEARASQAAAAAAQKPVATDENVQFTVFRRSAIQPEHWYPLLVFAHLADRRSDAPPDEPDPIEEVQAQARQLLGDDMGKFRSATEDSGYPVAREGELRFVPHMEGVTFNPPERRFLWTESVHREDFRLRADKSMDGHVARGAVSVFYGNLLLAEVQLSIKVDRKSAESHQEETHARPYRRIFASYSHRDTAIVEEFESHAVATGDRYLRDVVTLRAGEVWDQRLLEIIKQADVFQLFWSWNALSSPLVREEWRQALALNRPHFVRPVYWEEPLPEQAGLPPVELRRLHFQRVYPRIAPPPSPSALPSPALERTPLPSPALEPPPEVRRAPISRLISYGSAAAVLVAAVGLYFTVLNGPPAAEQSAPQAQTELPSTTPSRGGAMTTTPPVQNPAVANPPPAATANPPSPAVTTAVATAPVEPRDDPRAARRGAPPSRGGTTGPATSEQAGPGTNERQPQDASPSVPPAPVPSEPLVRLSPRRRR